MDDEVNAMTHRLLADHIRRRGGYQNMPICEVAKAATLAGVVAIKRVAELRRAAAVN